MSQMSVMVSPARSRRAQLAATVLLVCMALWSGAATAQPAPRTPAPPAPAPLAPAPLTPPPLTPAPLTNSATSLLPKTVIFAAVASVMDVAIGSVVTGGVVTGTAMAVVASASGWVLYQVHEMAWATLGPADQGTEKAVVTKTVTFTAANTLRLFGVGMLFTQNVVVSLSFVALDAIGDAGSYVVTDRIWAYFVPPSPVATSKSGS